MRLIHLTHIEELPAVIDVLIDSFEEDVIPIAYELAVNLVKQNFLSKIILG